MSRVMVMTDIQLKTWQMMQTSIHSQGINPLYCNCNFLKFQEFKMILDVELKNNMQIDIF